MKRAQLVKPCEPLDVNVTEIPKAPTAGLVIKTAFSGVCHSDVHQWEDKLDLGTQVIHFTGNPFYKLPAVPGHEIAGRVHSIGENQTGEQFEIGDRVVIYPWRGCGKCGYCKEGRSSLCHIRLYYGFDIPGGYSSFVLVPDTSFVVKLPDSIPLDMACMLPCSALTAYNAATTAKQHIDVVHKYEGNPVLLIIGAGGLGLWCLQIAKAILPSTTKIVVADIGEDKLAVARQRGCDDTVLWTRDADEMSILQQTCVKGVRNGFTAIVDFVNTSVTAERANKCLQPNGVHVMVGLYGGAAKLSLPPLVFGSRRIQGVYVGEIRQLRELILLLTEKKISPPPLRYFKLDDVTEALTLIKEGKMEGRGIIDFQQSSNL